MAFFGTAWAFAAIGGLRSAAGRFPWLAVVAVAAGLALLAAAAALFRLARGLPAAGADQRAEAGRIWRWFGIVFGAEGVLIFATSIVCGRLGRPDLIVPLILLIVGVHFWPLAALFRFPMHYVTGALLVAVAVVALGFPAMATVAGPSGPEQIAPREVVSGAGASLVLLLTGVGLAAAGLRRWRRATAPAA
jgi:hypothetical protein